MQLWVGGIKLGSKPDVDTKNSLTSRMNRVQRILVGRLNNTGTTKIKRECGFQVEQPPDLYVERLHRPHPAEALRPRLRPGGLQPQPHGAVLDMFKHAWGGVRRRQAGGPMGWGEGGLRGPQKNPTHFQKTPSHFGLVVRLYVDCSGSAPVALRWCSGRVGLRRCVRRWCAGGAPVVRRWCAGGAPALLRSKSDRSGRTGA
jgi:hypothetical protein